MSHQVLNNGGRIFSCDGCPDAVEFDKLDFNQAKESLTKWRWKIIPGPRGWQHFCPNCVEKSGNEERWRETKGR